MSTRARQLLLLAVAVLAFAGMIVLVGSGVSIRRARRDLSFGLEELDHLLSETSDPDAVSEAAAMVPWLAERARDVGSGLRVLKRAHVIYDRTGDATPMNSAARILLEEFPANTTIRTLAVFASVRSGRVDEALSIAREALGPRQGEVYAWTLLSASVRPESQEDEDDELVLAALGPESPAADFERAWELTGDPRYALDATLILLREQRNREALELSLLTGLDRSRPIFVAGLLVDRGRYAEARELLERLPNPSVETRLLLADSYLFTGMNDAAREIYRDLLASPNPPVEASINLAWLSTDSQRAVELLQQARMAHADWELDRAWALAGEPSNDGDQIMDRWSGTVHEPQARLLRLQIDTTPDRRGFAAELWRLLESTEIEAAFRYAAWYFFTRNRFEDVRIVLDRAAALRGAEEHEPGWSVFYEGLLAAREDSWEAAANRFEASFVRSPSWPAALNASIALFRTAEQSRGRERLQDALLLARNSPDSRRITAFLVAARAAPDGRAARALVDEAIAIDPGSPEALLLAGQLENPTGR